MKQQQQQKNPQKNKTNQKTPERNNYEGRLVHAKMLYSMCDLKVNEQIKSFQY